MREQAGIWRQDEKCDNSFCAKETLPTFDVVCLGEVLGEVLPAPPRHDIPATLDN